LASIGAGPADHGPEGPLVFGPAEGMLIGWLATPWKEFRASDPAFGSFGLNEAAYGVVG
jgi:hypothetical protein